MSSRTLNRPSYLLLSISVCMLLMFTMGCSGSKRLKDKKEGFQAEEMNAFFDQLDILEMKGKIRITLDEGAASYNANLTVREKDNKIWFTVKFIGMEFFRGLIDEDSVQILDRNGKEHLTATWDAIQKTYHDDLTYETFRNLLLGNPFLVKGANYGFYKKEDVYEYDYTSEASSLLISILFNKRLKESLWVLENDKIAIEAKYEQYDSPTLKIIPYFRQYILYFHNTQPINIQMEIKNYSFDDSIIIPFEVPDRYSHSNLLSK